MKFCEGLFHWTAVTVLLTTAGAKLISASGSAPILDWPDPLFGLANRQMLLLAAALEVGVVLALAAPMSGKYKHLLVCWLSANFVVYRLALHLVSPGRPCPCLGSLTERLNLGAQATGILLWSIALYLLLGSAGLLVTRRSAPAGVK